ncbi:unnamed protein product [Chilo suppressalis]|uniref:Kazal-like domain-containing protein n=1 Tax=Chilo suppressalis TaxID=168631 RepID=A0ABN8B871_CHISP|nr:unnamed protein product [Chilo suppressalis]
MQRINLILFALSFLISIAIATSNSNLKKKLLPPKLWKACKNIKCPPIEDPVCVKIKYRNAKLLNKTIYIYMINKCELDYMKCHQDAEGVIVSKKYCEHTKPSSLAKKRVKRNANKDATNNAMAAGSVSKKHVVRRQYPPSGMTDKDYLTEDLDDNEKRISDDCSDENKPGCNKLQRERDSYYNEDSRHKDYSKYDSRNEDYSKEDSRNKDSSNDDSRNEDFSKEGTRATNSNEEIDIECPTECELRKVMVCGKCQHGVYRTFMSPCHMRLFMCNNTDESMELMSRYPCVLSAPFASEFRGSLSEPSDFDEVQRFIYCREAMEDGTNIVDSRCADVRNENFEEQLQPRVSD